MSTSPVERVLAGIDAAAVAGLRPIKINSVVQRGVNDHTVVDLARHFRGTGHIVRFIEFMDVGKSNGWRLDAVVSGGGDRAHDRRRDAARAHRRELRGEVVRRWRYAGGSGEIGVITSVTQPFCGACTRARISAEGKLYTCLFATTGTDLRAPCAMGAVMKLSRRPSAASGSSAKTATRSCARPRRRSCRDRDVVYRRVRGGAREPTGRTAVRPYQSIAIRAFPYCRGRARADTIPA